jgi:hypothetical protein
MSDTNKVAPTKEEIRGQASEVYEARGRQDGEDVRLNNRQKGAGRAKQPKSILTEDEIARRAYEIYLDRGRKNGHDIDDWLVAEKELSEQDFSSPQKMRPAATGQRQFASVDEDDPEHSSPVHHDRIDPSRDSTLNSERSCSVRPMYNESVVKKHYSSH